MRTHTGKAKVKDDYEIIYKGYTLDILGVYIDYKNGNGMGVYADGTREYKLSLKGTPFPKSHNYNTTVIHDSHLEILELNEATVFPLDESEANRLVDYIKSNPLSNIDGFLESERRPSTAPTPDLTTLYDDDDERNN